MSFVKAPYLSNRRGTGPFLYSLMSGIAIYFDLGLSLIIPDYQSGMINVVVISVKLNQIKFPIVCKLR